MPAGTAPLTLPDSLGGLKLLNGVNGHVRPGKVTAILGPSGAGKTVLFTALLGKLEPSWAMDGTLLINGDPDRGKYKSSIGFVPQDDVLHSELTVEGNVYYASELRLPGDWTDDERETLRDAVLELMHLAHLRDAPGGRAGVTGLNGGKRKALSIAVELAAAPLALFLDEPTTGLDAATSLHLCRVLKDVAVKAHVSIAMVVHQPRAEIFNALDEVLILAPGGYTVYQGPQSHAAKYFHQAGVAFRPEQNPADVIMDAVAARGSELVDLWRRDYSAGSNKATSFFTRSPQFVSRRPTLPSATSLAASIIHLISAPLTDASPTLPGAAACTTTVHGASTISAGESTSTDEGVRSSSTDPDPLLQTDPLPTEETATSTAKKPRRTKRRARHRSDGAESPTDPPPHQGGPTFLEGEGSSHEGCRYKEITMMTGGCADMDHSERSVTHQFSADRPGDRHLPSRRPCSDERAPSSRRETAVA